MKKSVFIFLLLLSFLKTNHAMEDENVILILPFNNHGSIEYEKFSDQIVTYFYALIDGIQGYSAVAPSRMKEYKEGYIYKTKSITGENYYRMLSQDFTADLIIDGDYLVENEKIIVSFEVFNNSQGSRKKKLLSDIEIEQPITYTFDKLFIPIIEELTGSILETSILNVITDQRCNLILNGEYLGITPIKIRLLEAEYQVKITHHVEDYETTIFDNTVIMKKEEDKIIDIPVFVSLSITADRACSVFINQEESGITPFKTQVYSGTEYLCKVLYSHSEKEQIIAYDNVISTKNYNDISFHLNENGRIIKTTKDAPFSCTLYHSLKKQICNSFDNLTPGEYILTVSFNDQLWMRKWKMKTYKIPIRPFDKVYISLDDIRYKKNTSLCLVPSLCQFYNHESVKGISIISLFSGSVILTSISAIVGNYYYYNYKENLSSYSAAEEEKAYQNINIYNYLITSGVILGIISYLYSAIDGYITMEHLDNIINLDSSHY